MNPLAEEIAQMLQAEGEKSAAELVVMTRRPLARVHWALRQLEEQSRVATVRRRTDSAILYFVVAHLGPAFVH